MFVARARDDLCLATGRSSPLAYHVRFPTAWKAGCEPVSLLCAAIRAKALHSSAVSSDACG
jgi:predicted dithiol-disulfide oxidoreductase (DUF899 family)